MAAFAAAPSRPPHSCPPTAGAERALLGCLRAEDTHTLTFACAALQNLCHEGAWSEIVMAHGAQARPSPATQEPPLPSLAAKCCPPLGVSGAAGRVGAPHRPDGGAVCFGSSQEHAGNEEAPPCYLLRTLTSLPLLPAPFPFVCPVLYLLPPLAPLPPSPRPP